MLAGASPRFLPRTRYTGITRPPGKRTSTLSPDFNVNAGSSSFNLNAGATVSFSYLHTRFTTALPSPAAALQIFFWAPVSINIEKRCNHYRLIVACMLSGASRDRPVIVGWSTALRGQVINESLGQLPKKRRVLARTESSGTQSGTKQGGPPHDHWAKLGQLRYTRSQYSFVAIALFARVY